MIQRIAIVLFVIGLMPGCGMAMRKIDRESLAAATTVTRTFPESPHRVAIAAFETLKDEMGSVYITKDIEFYANPKLAAPDGSKPPEGQVPEAFRAFWMEWKQKDQTIRELMTLRAVHYLGKTRDGRPVEVAVLDEPDGTVMTIHVDDLGDRMYSQAIYEKVVNRLAHPPFPPGSIEEAAKLKEFFGGVQSNKLPAKSRKKAEASGSAQPGTT